MAARPDSWLAGQPLPLVSVPYRSEVDPSSWWTLGRALLRKPVDVVHCHADRDLANAALPAWLSRVPLIRSQHTHVEGYSGWLGWSYGRCAAVVSVSDCQLSHSRTRLPGARHRRIYNAVEAFRPEPIPERMREGYWVGYIGGFQPCKNVAAVVQACSQWLRHDSDARLLLLGDGPDRQAVERTCAEFGPRVWLPGHQAPGPFLSGLKLFMHAGRQETFSLACLEALSAGVPVIAHASGGIPEVVSHGVCGWLGEELRKGLETYLRDEELRRAHADAAPAEASRFGWDGILKQWEELYESVISPRKR